MIALLAAALAGSAQLETFDHVVERVPAMQPEGWDDTAWRETAVRLRKPAKKAKTASELRPVLTELLASLGASHHTVLPRSWDGTEDPIATPGIGAGGGGTAGLVVATLDDRVVVWRVAPGSPADVAGIARGDVVESVDGKPVEPVRAALFAHESPTIADLMLRAWVHSRVDGTPDGTVALGLEGGRTVEVGRTTDGVFVAPGMGTMPSIASTWTETAMALPGRDATARYVGFEVFAMPVLERFTRAVESAKAGDAGLVVDLRGNPGGVLGVGQGMAGFLVREKTTLGTTRAAYGWLELGVSPRPARQRFDGPVAILVDRGSASTSEILAAGLSQAGRARVFGSTTAGMALPSQFESLPNGDVLQLATGDYTAPDGTRVEGHGFTPDAPVSLTLEALREGRDPVLDAALAWIAEQAPADAIVPDGGEP
ncbi:MAG: PDZ domain-containing protein [Alphaproteobacteria bacterium]|nr:PDZ domain-containing protein [Alphaproteobacteria bacterium]